MRMLLLYAIRLFLSRAYEVFEVDRKGDPPALAVGFVHDALPCAAGCLFYCVRVCEQEAGGCGSGYFGRQRG